MAQSLAYGRYLGQTSGRYSTGGLLFCETEYPPSTLLPEHEHENAFFYLVTLGDCTDFGRGRKMSMGPSSLVFHPAGERHSNRWESGGRCFHIEVSLTKMSAARELAPILDQSACAICGEANRLAWRIYREFSNRDDLSPLVLEGLVFELLAEWSRQKRFGSEARSAPRWLLNVRDLLHDEFAQKPSMARLATEAGVHHAHLSRTFRQRFGCSIGEYIRQLRVDFACRRLEQSNDALAALALDAGFADQSHFSKTFKRLMKVTPAEYQRAAWMRNPRTI